MVPILISKDVFEPSYNDLKFMVWNCNYFCINLIISRVTVILSIIRPIQNSKVPPWLLPTMSPLSKFFLDYILFYTLLYLLLLTEASVSPCLMRRISHRIGKTMGEICNVRFYCREKTIVEKNLKSIIITINIEISLGGLFFSCVLRTKTVGNILGSIFSTFPDYAVSRA